ncbi:hypothetical protein ACQYAD_14840 [Neobacillus sp. SM06]|uniref:hypothetical protein n=1 Tax=Neobacillus sp. SM06 TaxID=3422492 RepID=UPI003D2D24C4
MLIQISFDFLPLSIIQLQSKIVKWIVKNKERPPNSRFWFIMRLDTYPREFSFYPRIFPFYPRNGSVYPRKFALYPDFHPTPSNRDTYPLKYALYPDFHPTHT